jgi:hypothetical protein
VTLANIDRVSEANSVFRYAIEQTEKDASLNTHARLMYVTMFYQQAMQQYTLER